MTVYLYAETSCVEPTWNVSHFITDVGSDTIATWAMERVDHIRFVYTVVRR